MKTDELRERYLEFFEGKGCVRRPSDVLVPRDDPSVLFTPAGMNQFKNQFLGIGPLDFTKATTSQKCLRTGDISNVGVTAYHHTFFEMLGNFSFGDYFKKEAIEWAWEFLTSSKWLGLDRDRLTVTVYLDDDEAAKLWHEGIGLPADRITRENEYENFWPAGAPTDGPDGVCGPCSEIYYSTDDGGKVEIWNLVFTQFNRVGAPPDNLRPLPKKNIDTGMGLERCAAVLQDVKSNFEIDLLRPLCVAAGDAVSVKYDFDAPEGRALRRIADHVRAVTFCIHEGVQPGTKEESYVVRQLLRRAVLEGYMLGRQEPFLSGLVPAVVELMGPAYPELAETVESVRTAIRLEEETFLNTIDKGLQKFERCVQKAASGGKGIFSGDDAFDLHTTDGFLVELTQALAAQRNLEIDMTRFGERLAEHQDVSGRGAFDVNVMAEGPLDAIRKTHGDSEFVGYEKTTATAKILGIVAEDQLVEQLEEVGRERLVAVILDRTPFYAEAGGQVGDTGTLSGPGFSFDVRNTQRKNGLILHLGHLGQGRLALGESVTAEVAADRRSAIRRAHSATHLMHHALRTTLGENATQRGSVVTDDSLRFDFAHGHSVSADELRTIEDIVNTRIAEGASVSTALMPLDEARSLGAMALFGEKYPDKVRVVTMGDFSRELCGGTHLSSTGQVGLFKIVREEASSAGVRRITALTGPKALQRMREQEDLLKELCATLKTPQPEDLVRRAAQLQDELRDAKRQLAEQVSRNVSGSAESFLEDAVEVNGVRILARNVTGVPRETLREYADQLRRKFSPIAIILGAEIDGKVALLAAVSKELIERGLKAGDCVKTAAKIVGGGGGGRPDLAEAGGKDPSQLDKALKAGQDYYSDGLK